VLSATRRQRYSIVWIKVDLLDLSGIYFSYVPDSKYSFADMARQAIFKLFLENYMSKGRWTSIKEPELQKKWLDELNTILAFANTDAEDSVALMLAWFECKAFGLVEWMGHQRLGFATGGNVRIFRRGTAVEESELEAKRAAQRHLRERLDAIIDADKNSEAVTLFETQMVVKTVISFQEDRFNLDLDLPVEKKIDMQIMSGFESVELNVKLLEIMQKLDLKPSRFRRCKRTKCSIYHYQPTSRPKVYCSLNCSKVDRQWEYDEKKRAERNREG
jgi:hypothetical protein